MIVDVSINLKFIGGQSLSGPVSQLQNALSFSYFGNTELYDERSNPVAEIPPETLEKKLTDFADDVSNLFKKPEGSTTTPEGETGFMGK